MGFDDNLRIIFCFHLHRHTSFRERSSAFGCRDKVVKNSFPPTSKIVRLSINDMWEFSFLMPYHNFLFPNAIFTQISFYCQICFIPVCARLCFSSPSRPMLHFTCLVMQMSSMQIHYRLGFLKGNCHFYFTLCFSSSPGYY